MHLEAKMNPLHLNALDISLKRMDTDFNKIGWFWAVISQIYYRFFKKGGVAIMQTGTNNGNKL